MKKTLFATLMVLGMAASGDSYAAEKAPSPEFAPHGLGLLMDKPQMPQGVDAGRAIETA